jgi:thioredoxin 1
MEEIILWESSVERIHACETAIYGALRKIGYKANLVINSETPLLSRQQLWQRLPVLEIRGQLWNLNPGRAFTVDQLTRLFTKIFIDQTFTASTVDRMDAPSEHKKLERQMIDSILLTDNDYQAKLEHTNGILLFYKKLCPNCKAIEKMLEKFFNANPEITYLRIDSEDSPIAMKSMSVERVPTICVLRDGHILSKKVGLMNLREMTDFYQSTQN